MLEIVKKERADGHVEFGVRRSGPSKDGFFPSWELVGKSNTFEGAKELLEDAQFLSNGGHVVHMAD